MLSRFCAPQTKGGRFGKGDRTGLVLAHMFRATVERRGARRGASLGAQCEFWERYTVLCVNL